MCVQCGAVFRSPEGENHRCQSCIETPKPYGIARAFGIYDATLMTLIHRFKYEGKIQLAKPFGTLLISVYYRFWEESSVDLILPVPLHAKRLRKRGFNQAHWLVKVWQEISEARCPLPPVTVDVLTRNRRTEPQTGLGRKERARNIRHAFSVSDHAAVRDRKILLVDDVYTTGATVGECTKILLKAGVRQVDVLTLARA